jgi:hypothetical protein
MNHTVGRRIDHVSASPERTDIHVIHSSRDARLLFKPVVLLYLALVIFAEVITTYIGVISGAILHGVLLVGLTNLSYFSRSASKRRVYLAFMLLPLLRILSLAMPIQQVAPIFQYLLTGMPLLLSTLLVVRVNGLPAFRLNLSALEWIYQVIIGASGIPLGLIAGLTLSPLPGLISNTNLFWFLILWIVFTIFGAVLEEIIFRGLLQKVLSSTLGSISIFLTSLLYASMFLGTLSPGYLIFYGFTGLLFSIWVHISDSLVGVIIAHSLMNIVFLLFTYLFR